MKTYTIGVLACSIVRGLPGDLVALKVRVKATDRAGAVRKAYPHIFHLAQEITDPTIKYVSVFCGREGIPGELPMRQYPFQLRIADGVLLFVGKPIK